MARYTVELRKVVESTNIFDFHYDFYDKYKKAKFEDDFIRHFYFREIGCETVDRFKWLLNDKMQTVFPYYNKLFEAATKEYSILENYYMIEESTTERDNKGKTFGVSSSVGRTQDEQTATGTESQNTSASTREQSTSAATSTGEQTTESQTQGTTSVERSETVNGQTSATQTVEGTKDKTTTDNETSEQEDKKRFLDTPQGAVDLTNVNYLTTLNQDSSDKEINRTGSEKETDSQTTDGSGSETRNTSGDSSESSTGSTTGTTTNESESNTTATTTGTAQDNATAESSTSYTAEQKTTADNNTRSYTEGEAQEKTVLTRHGNIGVMSDADMMHKHIELQKILSKIEKLFFDECEDLFMLVY